MKNTASMNRIDARLQDLEPGSYRYHVLEACKKFKTTWMQLGEILHSVHRDALYKEWGYENFEKYCSKELGIKHATALKLLKSYYFLEKEETSYVQRVKSEPEDVEQKLPDLEAVNALRLARTNPNIESAQYGKLRKQVLEDAVDAKDVKKSIRMMSEQTAETKDPEQVRAERRMTYLKKVVRFLDAAKLEAMGSRFLPPQIIDQLDDIQVRIEKELDLA
ncbi:MAG: hypothetical protein KC649_00575 [Candidatus Omnitrophica bacterium]|nr:hypothetical protein [Candidatus Omnitrophota bacterium]